MQLLESTKYGIKQLWSIFDFDLVYKLCNNKEIQRDARDADPGADPEVAAVINPTNATFKRIDTKLFAPVVILSTEDDNKELEQLKTEFKRTIGWNKYRSNQTETNNLYYLVDLTFSKVNRLFVLLFKNEDDRTSFSKYYTPSVEIQKFNVLIDAKSFFWCVNK